jgi:hypothetical protein
MIAQFGRTYSDWDQVIGCLNAGEGFVIEIGALIENGSL